MNNIIKKINLINTKLELDIKYINLDQLIDQILLSEQNKLITNDIKDYNDRQKIILDIFLNKFVHLFPIVSLYNTYIKLIKGDINLLTYKPIFRGFYNAINVIKSSKCKITNNILQIGILPTFVEAIHILNESSIIDFIQIYSSKYESNHKLYNNMISKLTNDYNLINDIEDFYHTPLNLLLNNNKLLDRYDLIIFDTYKNIYKIDIDSIQSNINQRYLLSILNSKYILFQIIFSLNKLNTDGDLILLFSGSDHLIYQQIITILSNFFNEILLINSDIDYSYRYFLICKKFNSNTQLINKLNIDMSNNKILINILNVSNKILDINFEKYLQIKFNNIRSNISYIEQIFNNQLLIDKIYTNNYYYQLNNTYNWINTIFKKTLINNDIITIINRFKNNVIVKLNKQYINSYIIKTDDEKLNYLGEIVNYDTFKQLITCINYIQLIEILNNNTRDKTFNINSLINEYNLDNPLYVENIDKYFFENIKDQIIIKFNLKSLNPFILSIFYICVIIYNKSIITSYYNEYYFICIGKSRQTLLNNIIKLYNSNIKNIDSNTQIVIINEDFILQINKVLNKLFIRELINNIRLNIIN